MKRFFGVLVAFMLLFSTMAYAGGGQVCGDKAAGPAGSTGDGQVEQNRNPAD